LEQDSDSISVNLALGGAFDFTPLARRLGGIRLPLQQIQISKDVSTSSSRPIGDPGISGARIARSRSARGFGRVAAILATAMAMPARSNPCPSLFLIAGIGPS
jgi:hypothetical protein